MHIKALKMSFCLSLVDEKSYNPASARACLRAHACLLLDFEILL